MRYLLAGLLMVLHPFNLRSAPTIDHLAAASVASASVAGFDTTATIHGTAWFQAMYDKGFRLYIMHSTAWGTCTPWSRAEVQLANALSVGLKVAVYTRDPNCWRGGVEAAGPLIGQLEFFALDIETDPGVPATRAMVGGLTEMGVRPVIYAGSAMWPQVQGFDDRSFAHVPLWDTDVTGDVDPHTWSADITAPTPVAYGGWNEPGTSRVIVQQAFDVTIDGVLVDLDSVDATFLRP